MKKIMFSDRYMLTQAVLSRSKTMTRRPVRMNAGEYHEMLRQYDKPDAMTFRVFQNLMDRAPYKMGERVAIAQSYRNSGFAKKDIPQEKMAGWLRKMFIDPAMMPHHILIKEVYIDQLYRIPDGECFDQGVRARETESGKTEYFIPSLSFNGRELRHEPTFSTPQDAYFSLVEALEKRRSMKSAHELDNARLRAFDYVYRFVLLD